MNAELFLKLAVALALIGANAFFVAAEFSLVSVRRTRIRELVDSGVIAKQPRFCMTFFNLALAYGFLEKFEECKHWFGRLHEELRGKNV